MRKRLITIVGILLSGLVLAQNTDVREITPFDKIKVSGEVKVYVEKGDRESVTVKTNEIPTSDIISEIKNKTLEIRLKNNLYKNVKAEVYVTYRELRDIHVSGAAYVSVNDTLMVDKLTLTVKTSSEFDGTLMANTADLRVTQASTARLRGKVNNYEAQASTGGILAALELQSDSTFVKVSSGATAKVYASELLDAKIQTGGSLVHTGGAKQKNVKSFLGSKVYEQ